MAPRTRSSRSGADLEQDNKAAPEKTPQQTTATRNDKDKTYRKETPRPELKQVRFPARSTTVRPKKTYGKKRHSMPARLPPSSTSKRTGKAKDEDPHQSTLTQIGWVPSTFPEDDDELEPLSVDMTADGSASDDGGAKAKKGTRHPRTKKAGGKRRRTMEDLEVERNNQEDDGDTRPRSSFHTQTLTQMPSWRQSGEEDVDDIFFGSYEDELNKPAAGVEDVLATTSSSKKRKRPSPPQPQSQASALVQTPAKQRIPPAEIPSSQPSPFTPNLVIERRGWSPLAEGTDRTPLKNRSTNVGAPTPSANGRILKRKTSEIPDSYSTLNGGMSSTPSTKRTPLKDITPWEGTADASIDAAEPVEQARVQSQEDGGKPPTQKSQRPQDEVIVDSDDEFEMPDEEPEAPGTPTPVRRAPPVDENLPEHVNSPVAEVAVSTPSAGRGMGDANTSFGKVTVAVEQVDLDKSSPTPQQQPSNPNNRPTQDLNPAVEEDVTDPETPSQRRRRPSTSSVAEKETPLSSLPKTSPAMPPISQLGYKSQGFESQRVPFEVIRQMAPQTDRSDVILSIHPDHVKDITDGTKTHEFRNYKIPATVARIWIYVTRPVCQLKYMATLGQVKLPGEIDSNAVGIGNKEFNEGIGSKFAYELKQVYQLNNPVPLAQMKENGWVEEAPVRYVYVPPAVLGELMGNLQRALFLEPGEMAHPPTQPLDDVTISQELEEQLRTDIAHSTQLMRIASSPRPTPTGAGEKEIIILSSSQDANMEEEDDEEEHIAETPVRSAKRATGRQVAFAQTTTIGASSSGSQLSFVEDSPPAPTTTMTRGGSSQAQRRPAVRPSQATTASVSSPSQRLPSQPSRSQRGHVRNSNSSQQAPVPVSPSPARKQRTPEARRPGSSISVPGARVLEEEDDLLVVDDSPVVPRGRPGDNHDTQSSLGIRLSLLGSSSFGVLGLGEEQDSLMDDSKIRRPPSEIAWDSEGGRA